MNKEITPCRDLLERNGYRFTAQKQRILEEILIANTHLSVKEIYERVKEKHIGIATVYRNLKCFETLGIVKEINENGMRYYEKRIYSGQPLHIHFKCFICNCIIDIDDYTSDLEYLKINRKIEENSQLEIHDANIMLIGICPKCREDKEKCQGQPNIDV